MHNESQVIDILEYIIDHTYTNTIIRVQPGTIGTVYTPNLLITKERAQTRAK